MKWLLVTVAVLLVIAISVGVTLFFTRDGSGDGGQTSTSSTPTASGDIASANDTGPVAIITADPTCDSWRPIQNGLAASQSDEWAQRDPTAPASTWTPELRAQFEAAANGMRTAADQAVDLAERTPHRVMRELYEQFIAYGRAYADALPSYVPDDDVLSKTSVSLSSAIAGVCDAIIHGNIAMRASAVPTANPPSQPPEIGNPTDPERFVTEVTKACAQWVTNSATFQADLQEWERFDTSVPANQWTPEQRRVQDTAAITFERYASDIATVGKGSGNAVFEDFANLAALYLRAYSSATPTYTVADDYIVTPGLRINSAIANACQAAAG